MAEVSTRTRHARRLEDLKRERGYYEAHWRELAEYNDPTRLRLNSSDKRGQENRQKIIDSTGTFAQRTLASGLHSGLTSPARPWFRLTTFDPALKEFGPVKAYYELAETRMREVFGGSNFYTSAHSGYFDLGLFGQFCGLMVGDRDRYIRMHELVHGEFWIANDETGRVGTLYRRVDMTVEQMVARFDYDKCSRLVRSFYDKGNYDEWVVVYHAIEERKDRDPRKIDKRNKAWLSNYWEDADGNENRMLEESGFEINPIIAPRWATVGADHYASASPGEIALPDVRMLQMQQQRKGEGIDKMVRPPMVGPPSLRNNPKSILPGGLTYVDDPTGKGFRPVFEVNPRLSELREDIRDVQDRIRQANYADLFLMLSQLEGVQPRNQFEIAERKEEKLLALGPVLERLFNEMLKPVIDVAFWHMQDRGILPEPPQELQGQEIKVEFISILAQAQKAVATGGIERFVSFVGNLAAAKPDVLDKADFDQAVDEYGDMLGVIPSVIVPDDKVAEIRQARAAKQQAAESAELAATAMPAVKQGAEAARLLAETDANGGVGSLLSNLGIAG